MDRFQLDLKAALKEREAYNEPERTRESPNAVVGSGSGTVEALVSPRFLNFRSKSLVHSPSGDGKQKTAVKIGKLPRKKTPRLSTTDDMPCGMPKFAPSLSESHLLPRLGSSSAFGAKKKRSSSILQRFRRSSSQVPKTVDAVLQQRALSKNQKKASKFDLARASDLDSLAACEYAMRLDSEYGKWPFDVDAYVETFAKHHLHLGDLLPELSSIIDGDLKARSAKTFGALLREGTSFTCRVVTAASKMFECEGGGGSSVELAAEGILERVRALSVDELESCVMLPTYVARALNQEMWVLDEELASKEHNEQVQILSEQHRDRFASLFEQTLGCLLVASDEMAPALKITPTHSSLLGLIRSRVLFAFKNSGDHELSIPEQQVVALEQVSSALFLKRFNPVLISLATRALDEIADQTSIEYKKAWHVKVVVIQLTKGIQKLANHKRFEENDGPMQMLNSVLNPWSEPFDELLKASAPVAGGSSS